MTETIVRSRPIQFYFGLAEELAVRGIGKEREILEDLGWGKHD